MAATQAAVVPETNAVSKLSSLIGFSDDIEVLEKDVCNTIVLNYEEIPQVNFTNPSGK